MRIKNEKIIQNAELKKSESNAVFNKMPIILLYKNPHGSNSAYATHRDLVTKFSEVLSYQDF